jgi:hypothetical protein
LRAARCLVAISDGHELVSLTQPFTGLGRAGVSAVEAMSGALAFVSLGVRSTVAETQRA